ncbi:MAG: glycoside hydrolase family 32 protein [Bacteroidetes bacterium]|nr:glycoside hydrolase family 32 protein [Bacteroidota bacterium]
MSEPNDPYSVFDPCIWKKDDMYYSLSVGRKSVGPDNKPVRANYLFRSKDLANWEFMHPFVEEDRFTRVGDDGACPYFWPIRDRYIMPFFSHTSGGQYLLGDYDKSRDKFVVTNHGKFNFGAVGPGGVHAPSAVPDGNGGLIIIFNMNPGKPTVGWNQIMSLPRRLTMIEENEIGMEPYGDIESLRYGYQQVDAMTLPANEEIVFKNIKGNALEIIAEIDPKDAQMIEMNVLRSPKKEEYTRIVFQKDRGKRKIRPYGTDVPRQPDSVLSKARNVYESLITIESSYSSVLPDVRSRAPETGPIVLEQDETLKLRIFIDKSVVEVFANGRQCVAQRVYPGLEESVGVSLRSQRSESQPLSLEAWQMKSIYEQNEGFVANLLE